MSEIEYKENTVTLGVEGKSSAGPGITQQKALHRAATSAEPLAAPEIARVVEAEGARGWTPDQPTDLSSLLAAGQVRWQQTGGLVLSWKFTFVSATLRFRRSAQSMTEAGGSGYFCAECRASGATDARFCASCGRSLGAASSDGDPRCSFCGRGASEVRKLVSGRGAFICDECVASFRTD